MVKVGLLVQLQAKAGKEAIVAKFLADALTLANQESRNVSVVRSADGAFDIRDI